MMEKQAVNAVGPPENLDKKPIFPLPYRPLFPPLYPWQTMPHFAHFPFFNPFLPIFSHTVNTSPSHFLDIKLTDNKEPRLTNNEYRCPKDNDQNLDKGTVCCCPICGKRFTRHWLLQGHIRTHTGEKPFKCPVCSKAFADKSNLRAHIQTHSGLKPFSCKRCGKEFALKSYLSKHEESACFKMR